MGKLFNQVPGLFLFLLRLYISDAVANRLDTYDNLSCPQADVMFLQTNIRSRVECVTRCSELFHCACVFYKQGYCRGCRGLCHHGHYRTPLPIHTGTTYFYMNRDAAIGFADGVIFDNNNYYLIVRSEVSWEEALNQCHSLQATLLYVETQAELEFLNTLLDGVFYWTGGIQSGGQYVWSHNGASINMTLFAPGEPSSDGQCVGMLSYFNFQLHDYDCSFPWYFVCKSF